MISTKERAIDLIWSPSKNDDFIIYENEISLYRLKGIKPINNSIYGGNNLFKRFFQSIYTSTVFPQDVTIDYHHPAMFHDDNCDTELLGKYTIDTSYPKAVSWYRGNENEYTYAAAFSNQKLQIIK